MKKISRKIERFPYLIKKRNDLLEIVFFFYEVCKCANSYCNSGLWIEHEY